MKRLLCALLLIMFASTAHAATISLAWIPGTAGINPTTGYKIYYGTVSGTHPSSVDVGNILVGSITGLTVGITYYFTITAYSIDGEGIKSTEVSSTATDNAQRPIAFSAASYPR